MTKRLEDLEQEAVVQWCRMNPIPGTNDYIGDYLLAIPNEGKRSPRQGHKMKKRGMMPGASDLFLAIPCGAHHGLWIEMKKQRQHFDSQGEADRAVTGDQIKFQLRMKTKGYVTDVCYGAGEALQTIKDYLT